MSGESGANGLGAGRAFGVGRMLASGVEGPVEAEGRDGGDAGKVLVEGEEGGGVFDGGGGDERVKGGVGDAECGVSSADGAQRVSRGGAEARR